MARPYSRAEFIERLRLLVESYVPHTGVSPTALSSVAVAAPTGMQADALTKPMMVLDLAAARALLARFPGAGAIWIDKGARIVATQDLALSMG